MENTTAPQMSGDMAEALVLKIFADNNFELTDELKKEYVPELSAQLEQRIGLHLITKIPEDRLDEYAALIDKDDATADDWSTFWQSAVPNFEGEMKTIVDDFSTSVKDVMAM
ncbi:MAG: hypothetical protein HOL80_01380 [Candidatus Magasanikbacteria bacterium]|jgi:hypothetical protein|nr:hypothetical protein [Candidatus Magasanikbacteria bacterium]MBT5262534.1 hypothetical protein [Candidatus Magasanikbacteria bacterium]MBT5820639.1 hypothetical protein [Candidatus Magasanikbacteria bacterium]MBT6294365.1 hypothetical protein [Candidatus Magasanikbacteria bacterium]|tara:strand:- start:282 stop:617 length:336 start_codon:yes stop_codon:yes gene_type:complete